MANRLNESVSLEKALKEGFFLCSDLLALSEAELLVLSVAHHSPTLLSAQVALFDRKEMGRLEGREVEHLEGDYHLQMALA